MSLDRQRWEAVRALQRLGWIFDGFTWTAPAANAAPNLDVITAAADAMHAHLMERADALAGTIKGSDDETELERIGELIEAYEADRWPTGLQRT